MAFKTLGTESTKVTTPFAITPQPSGNNSTNQHYVDYGVIFTSFSFATGTFLHINGLKDPLPFQENSKFYIEIDVLPNLQPENARIRCAPVGQSDSWPTYPNLYQIEPQDEVDDRGVVKKIVNNKTQTKCYILIGYREDDSNKNGDGSNYVPEDASNAAVQILNHNIILLASVVSGVPILFPMPYFDGATHQKVVAGDLS